MKLQNVDTFEIIVKFVSSALTPAASQELRMIQVWFNMETLD